MKDGRIADIIHDHFKKLGKHLARLKKDMQGPGFDGDTIHAFRVDIKKLRAFLRMLHDQKEDGSPVLPHRLKKIYSLAGKIRDRQLCIKRIQESSPGRIRLAKYRLSSLRDELKNLKNKHLPVPGKKELGETEKKINEHIHCRLSAWQAKNFFSQKLSGIHEIITERNFFDTELHSIRKNIKDILYVSKIFIAKKVQRSGFWFEKQYQEKLDQAAHALGAFNDIRLALSFLQLKEIRKSPPAEMAYLLSIRKKWLMEKGELKKKALEEIRKTGMS